MGPHKYMVFNKQECDVLLFCCWLIKYFYNPPAYSSSSIVPKA
jgi:hypothetical protein